MNDFRLPRRVVVITDDGEHTDGWIPAVVTEHQRGHQLLTGPAVDHWGSREDAELTAADVNARAGLSSTDIDEILLSAGVEPQRAVIKVIAALHHVYHRVAQAHLDSAPNTDGRDLDDWYTEQLYRARMDRDIAAVAARFRPEFIRRLTDLLEAIQADSGDCHEAVERFAIDLLADLEPARR